MDTHPAPRAATAAAAPDAFGRALARAAGGDPQLLDALRRLAWEDYVAAGAPCGLDEEGLARWWSTRLRLSGR